MIMQRNIYHRKKIPVYYFINTDHFLSVGAEGGSPVCGCKYDYF